MMRCIVLFRIVSYRTIQCYTTLHFNLWYVAHRVYTNTLKCTALHLVLHNLHSSPLFPFVLLFFPLPLFFSPLSSPILLIRLPLSPLFCMWDWFSLYLSLLTRYLPFLVSHNHLYQRVLFPFFNSYFFFYFTI